MMEQIVQAVAIIVPGVAEGEKIAAEDKRELGSKGSVKTLVGIDRTATARTAQQTLMFHHVGTAVCPEDLHSRGEVGLLVSQLLHHFRLGIVLQGRVSGIAIEDHEIM